MPVATIGSSAGRSVPPCAGAAATCLPVRAGTPITTTTCRARFGLAAPDTLSYHRATPRTMVCITLTDSGLRQRSNGACMHGGMVCRTCEGPPQATTTLWPRDGGRRKSNAWPGRMGPSVTYEAPGPPLPTHMQPVLVQQARPGQQVSNRKSLRLAERSPQCVATGCCATCDQTRSQAPQERAERPREANPRYNQLRRAHTVMCRLPSSAASRAH